MSAEARGGLLVEPISVDLDGKVTVTVKPGLRIELDGDRLNHFGDKYFAITSRGMAVETIR